MSTGAQPTLGDYVGECAPEGEESQHKECESPYVSRALERIEAAQNGEPAPSEREPIPAYRHDAIAPGGVLR